LTAPRQGFLKHATPAASMYQGAPGGGASNEAAGGGGARPTSGEEKGGGRGGGGDTSPGEAAGSTPVEAKPPNLNRATPAASKDIVLHGGSLAGGEAARGGERRSCQAVASNHQRGETAAGVGGGGGAGNTVAVAPDHRGSGTPESGGALGRTWARRTSRGTCCASGTGGDAAESPRPFMIGWRDGQAKVGEGEIADAVPA